MVDKPSIIMEGFINQFAPNIIRSIEQFERTLTKRLEKKLDGNYTRMLRAILNKSWQRHPTRHQLYGHLPPYHEIYSS